MNNQVNKHEIKATRKREKRDKMGGEKRYFSFNLPKLLPLPKHNILKI